MVKEPRNMKRAYLCIAALLLFGMTACADSSQKGDILDREYAMHNNGSGDMIVTIYVDAETKNKKTGDQRAEGTTTSASPDVDLSVPVSGF